MPCWYFVNGKMPNMPDIFKSQSRYRQGQGEDMTQSPEHAQNMRQLPRDIKLPPPDRPVSRAALAFWSAVCGAMGALLGVYALLCLMVG